MADLRRSRLDASSRRAGVLLLIPACCVVGLFLIVPLLIAVVFSFTRYDLLSAPRWDGLKNYRDLLSDPQFLTSIGNTVYFAIGQVVIGVVVALFVALLFNRRLVGGGAMRTLIYLPQAMSYVTVSLLWSYLYDPSIGPINAVLQHLGLDQINFLTSTNLAMPSIMIMSLWRNLGYYMIILLAGLKAVPPELIEAAHLDGAGWWSRLIHVTIPQLRSPMFFVVVTWFMGGLQMFTQSYVMTQGGPDNSTRTVVYSMYESAFLGLDFGKASAVGVLMLVVVLAVAIPTQVIRQIRSTRGASHA
jgi:ABC-type sugar transport system permease subunit